MPDRHGRNPQLTDGLAADAPSTSAATRSASRSPSGNALVLQACGQGELLTELFDHFRKLPHRDSVIMGAPGAGHWSFANTPSTPSTSASSASGSCATSAMAKSRCGQSLTPRRRRNPATRGAARTYVHLEAITYTVCHARGCYRRRALARTPSRNAGRSIRALSRTAGSRLLSQGGGGSAGTGRGAPDRVSAKLLTKLIARSIGRLGSQRSQVDVPQMFMRRRAGHA